VVPPDSDRVSRVRSYSGTSPGGHSLSSTGPLPSVVHVFHVLRLTNGFVTPASPRTGWKRRPTTPGRQRVRAYTCQVWADPLSLATTRGVSVDFLSSSYLDVSVRSLVPACLCIQHAVTPHYRRWVSPFGNPRVKGCSTPHRGLSQSSTPFIDSWCQGIHRVPLLS
jgi:hypothetical protein